MVWEAWTPLGNCWRSLASPSLRQPYAWSPVFTTEEPFQAASPARLGVRYLNLLLESDQQVFKMQAIYLFVCRCTAKLSGCLSSSKAPPVGTAFCFQTASAHSMSRAIWILDDCHQTAAAAVCLCPRFGFSSASLLVLISVRPVFHVRLQSCVL